MRRRTQIAVEKLKATSKRAAKRVARGQFRRHVDYPIGTTKIRLPCDHALVAYRKKWRLYDEPLRLLADGLHDIRPGFTTVDIGANVGDSAALISAGGSASSRAAILCIEGDPAYFKYLRRNAAALGAQVQIEECFVGSHDGSVNKDVLERHDGTTSASDGLFELEDSVPVWNGPHSGRLSVRRLESILDSRKVFQQPDLLKVDTDGFDFEILLSHEGWLASVKPVLYFEYYFKRPGDVTQARDCMQMLESIGYSEFMVFDNFGNPLMRTSDGVSALADLDRYLLSNMKFGQAVYYLDVCAVTNEDAAVLEALSRNVDRRVFD